MLKKLHHLQTRRSTRNCTTCKHEAPGCVSRGGAKYHRRGVIVSQFAKHRPVVLNVEV